MASLGNQEEVDNYRNDSPVEFVRHDALRSELKGVEWIGLLCVRGKCRG